MSEPDQIDLWAAESHHRYESNYHELGYMPALLLELEWANMVDPIDYDWYWDSVKNWRAIAMLVRKLT